MGGVCLEKSVRVSSTPNLAVLKALIEAGLFAAGLKHAQITPVELRGGRFRDRNEPLAHLVIEGAACGVEKKVTACRQDEYNEQSDGEGRFGLEMEFHISISVCFSSIFVLVNRIG